jgi:hypothetical protein
MQLITSCWLEKPTTIVMAVHLTIQLTVPGVPYSKPGSEISNSVWSISGLYKSLKPNSEKINLWSFITWVSSTFLLDVTSNTTILPVRIHYLANDYSLPITFMIWDVSVSSKLFIAYRSCLQSSYPSAFNLSSSFFAWFSIYILSCMRWYLSFSVQGRLWQWGESK